MPTFNRSGLLFPGSIISSNLTELELEFVTKIPTAERKTHFDAYIKYSDALKKQCAVTELVQWINGSFVTQKNRPVDIDLVTFIDYKIIESLGTAIKTFIYPQSELDFYVDAYIVAVYPTGSNKYHLYQSDKAYWNDKFDKTRRNRAGNILAKGFLEIIY
ncbi:MAG: hypothetical protein ABJB11_17430 [Ferruginibacter sp.]